jgi:hypothetical protein
LARDATTNLIVPFGKVGGNNASRTVWDTLGTESQTGANL